MSSPPRARTLRRQQQQIEAREGREIRRSLAAAGAYEKCARVNDVVAPGSRIFWRVYKDRVAARETLTPITTCEEARDVAVGVLVEFGVDMAGVTLKADWQPPRMVFEAVPAYELAVEAVKAVRSSERGKARRAKLGQLAARGQ